MRPHATFETPDGSRATLGHGDLIGRIYSASLRIDDPRVSEAHAMVSLRGRELRLLGLRGVFECDGHRCRALTLETGQAIALAPDLVIVVREVALPTHVLALDLPGVGREFLAGTTSLFANPRLRAESGYAAKADAWLWTDGDRWLFASRGAEPQPFREGEALVVGNTSVPVVRIELSDAAVSATRSAGGLRTKLVIVAHFDTVEIHPEGGTPVVLNGVHARLMSELVALDGPASWIALAREVWPDTDDKDVLRRRLDVSLNRMRNKLRDGGLRRDLVHSDGAGQVQLLLDPEDRVEDRT